MQLHLSNDRRSAWMDALREHHTAAIGVLLAVALTLAVLLALSMSLEAPGSDAPTARESPPATLADDAPSARATYAFGS